MPKRASSRPIISRVALVGRPVGERSRLLHRTDAALWPKQSFVPAEMHAVRRQNKIAGVRQRDARCGSTWRRRRNRNVSIST